MLKAMGVGIGKPTSVAKSAPSSNNRSGKTRKVQLAVSIVEKTTILPLTTSKYMQRAGQLSIAFAVRIRLNLVLIDLFIIELFNLF